MGSDELTDCICNIGFEGSDGMSCSACSSGSFKGVNGSGLCANCAGGLYQNMTAASSCAVCPAGNFSHSLVGSDAMTDCLCNVGYTGPDGGLCTACPAGTFKAIDGSGECVLCDAGTFQAATAATTASACLPCVPPDDSDPGSAECYTGDGLPRICYNRTLSLEEVCPARDVVVSGCAVGDVEFEIDVLQASTHMLPRDMSGMSIDASRALAACPWPGRTQLTLMHAGVGVPGGSGIHLFPVLSLLHLDLR
eukprot:2532177-Rhodomonas_salina.1